MQHRGIFFGWMMIPAVEKELNDDNWNCWQRGDLWFLGGGGCVFSCYTSISLKAQQLWSINRDGQSVCKAPMPRSSKPVKWCWGPITWKPLQLRNPSSSSPDVNSLSFEVEQHSRVGLFKSCIRRDGSNERAIHICRSTSTSTHFQNIKPQSGTLVKHNDNLNRRVASIYRD